MEEIDPVRGEAERTEGKFSDVKLENGVPEHPPLRKVRKLTFAATACQVGRISSMDAAA